MARGATGRERTGGTFARIVALAVVVAFVLAGVRADAALADDAGGHTPSSADRYSLANGCFALQSVQSGHYVVKVAGAYAATAASLDAAEPFRMRATDLGRYLLYDSDRRFLARTPLNTVAAANEPSDNSDWTVVEDGGFRLRVAGRDLAVGAGGVLTTVPGGSGGAPGLFEFVLTGDGACPEYPEVEVSVSGPLPAKTSPDEPVRGVIETHMHHMAFEFLGTKVHCGRPWHRFGAPYALRDCPDHELSGGCGAVLETALSGETCHDPGGWPSFTGWPKHTQYTHEQSYYKWLERTWRGGLRIFVNLLVENRVLCEIYPLTPQPSVQRCNEMDSVRRQALRARQLQDYIDAQNGGPGKGWYRIVESPAEARRVIADGKLAVVLGMEVSEPFNCRLMQPGDMPLCSSSQLDAGIDEIHDLGLRQVELVNKFDNALTGVAGDSGSTGTITNLGNLYSAGTFWDYETCEGIENPELNHDHSPTALSHNDDDLAAGVLDLFGDETGITFPVYGEPPHCNQRGLSDLGERAVRRLIAKGMLFDPDHMSVIGRNRALDIVEAERYPGAMTSHSWSTDNALPRISGLGGLIGPAAKSPAAFVADWAHVKAHGYDRLNPHLFGFGYGADMNGFASQGGPLPVGSQIAYPFTSPIDPSVTVHRQRSGTRTFDINTDGTAHYGLYADWTEGVRVAGGDEIIDDLANGAEAYLQMWERAIEHGSGGSGGGGGSGGDGNGGSGGPAGAGGPGTDSGGGSGDCRKWSRRLRRGGLGKRLRLGDDEAAVLAKAGEPRRRGDAWTWCAKRRSGKAGRVAAVFGDEGRVELIATTASGSVAGGTGRGSKLAKLRTRARPAGLGLWMRPAGRGDAHFFYRVRRGKVSYAGLTATRLGAKELRALLAGAGLK